MTATNLINQNISGKYRVEQKIGEGSFSVVYLAHDLQDENKKYALKVLKENSISVRTENIIRFNSEIAIAAHLDHQNIIRIFDFGRFSGCHYFIMEYVDGSSLDDYIRSIVAFSTEEAVIIVRQICIALDYIHSQGIIHRDLKPSNILIPTKDGPGRFEKVKLIDFGLSYIMEYGNLEEPDAIIGTFAYISPEQSGLIKRNVDERSDIYSLGVLFYQMITGDLPFKGDSISSLMHKHIASRPESFYKAAPGTPEVLEKVVFKMMEKDPEKRYQSAAAIVRDLDLYMRGYRDFVPGENEKVLRPYYRPRLSARDREMEKLHGLYSQAVKGGGCLCLISGAAGTGKTRLGEELHEAVNSGQGLFLSTKCYPAMAGAPYSVVGDLFNIYLMIFRKRSEWEKKKISSRLISEIGELGSVITNFSPALKELLGDCPLVVSLEDDRENRRFLTTFVRFISLLADIEKTLVIQVDDLQWSDEGSIALLREMAVVIHENPLLFIATYRSDEIGRDHSLARLILNSREEFRSIEEISCDSLDEAGTKDMVRGIMYRYENDALIGDITSFIYRKSAGNPLMTIEIIRQMIEEKSLYYADNKWFFDRDLAEKTGIPSRLIDIIIKRMSLFGDDEKNILSLASIFGRKIDIHYLFQLQAELDRETGAHGAINGSADIRPNEKRIIAIIDKAISLQVIEQDYFGERMLMFSHDRIREALYSSVEEPRRKSIHYAIARILEKAGDSESKGIIFDIAYHYIESGDEEKTLEFSMTAGMIAKTSYANEDALKYFNTCKSILEKTTGGDPAHAMMPLLIRCNENIGDIYLRTGELNGAIDLYNSILEHQGSPVKKGAVYRNICHAYFKMGDWDRCEKFAIRGLRVLGESLPSSRASARLGIFGQLSVHFLHNILPSIFVSRKVKTPEVEELKINLYLIASWMYILTDLGKFINTIIKMLNMSESRAGISRELGTSMAAYASMCMAIPLFPRAIRYHENALRIRDSLGDEWGVGQSLQWLGYCYAWQGDYPKSNKHFFRSVSIFRRIGDLWEIGMGLGGASYNAYINSDYDRCSNLTKEFQDISLKLNDYYGLARAYQHHAVCYIERGDYKTAEEYLSDAHRICVEHDLAFNLCYNYGALGYLNLEKGDYDKAVSLLGQAIDIEKKNNFLKYFIVFIYPLYAEAIFRTCVEKKKSGLVISRGDIRQMMHAADQALRKTKSWISARGISLRIMAMCNSVLGNNQKAETGFQASIDQLSKCGRKFDTAKSLLEYALFLERTGRIEEMHGKLEAAYRIFVEIGSDSHIKSVSRMLGLRNNESDARENSNYRDQQRLASLVAISRDITSILDIDGLLARVMNNAVEVTGAQRGLLFIKNADTGSYELRVSIPTTAESIAEYSQNIVDMAVKSGQTVITSDAESENMFSAYKSIVRFGLKSILCVPIRRRNETMGVCYLDNSLSSGVFTEEDGDILNLYMSQAAIAIDNAFFYSNLEKKIRDRTRELNSARDELHDAYTSVSNAFEIIKEDLSVARKVQQNILPREIDKIEGLTFFIKYSPMGDIGGDIYDITETEDGAVRLFLADATGHGIQASLVTMMIMGEYNKVKRKAIAPEDILKILNGFFSTLSPMKIVFSCAVADIRPGRGTVGFASAGHPTQYLLKKGGVIQMERTGRIIGMFGDSRYSSGEYPISQGDSLLFLTDGLYEHFNEKRESYGERRMMEIINKEAEKGPEGIFQAIYGDVEAFLHGAKKMNDDDDVTLIGVHVKTGPGNPATGDKPADIR